MIFFFVSGIMSEILKSVDVNGAIEYIPQLWSHMIIFDLYNRDNLLNQILKTMIENTPNPELPGQENLTKNFTDIAWSMYNKLEEFQEFRRDREAFRWSGLLLGDILMLISRGGDYEKALKIFEKIDKHENEMIGEPSPLALELFADLCISEKQPNIAINCLQFCVENGYPEAKTIGEKILSQLTLNESMESKVKRLLGKGIIT